MRGLISPNDSDQARVWTVSGLCHAISDQLKARFGMVSVQGEISGLTRAGSGHCYFTLKDEQGQLRCAMFRRTAETVMKSSRRRFAMRPIKLPPFDVVMLWHNSFSTHPAYEWLRQEVVQACRQL